MQSLLILEQNWKLKKPGNYRTLPNIMWYLFIFISGIVLTAALTWLVIKLAVFLQIVDRPDKHKINSRKIHDKPTPLLGGLAIFLAYFILLFLFKDYFLSGDLTLNHLMAFFIGALVIIIGGSLDDKYNLSPARQIIFPLLAIVVLLIGGVGIAKITNPLGGVIDFSSFAWLGGLLIFFWLLGMMYTTKLLDGVDGLVSGITSIGVFIIFLFTITTRYYQPDIAFASILLAGVLIGFLIFNWHPAKIFLGEGGSLLLGYILGVLAIISGGKMAIALLVMGIPILDVAWTIIRRLARGKNPFRFSDKKHLHHRLLSLGLSQRQTVLIFCATAFLFGISGLFLQSKGKFILLGGLLVLMMGVVFIFQIIDKRAIIKKPKLLLHVCCAPCAAFISVYYLPTTYNVTWYFYNPNLLSEEEYNKRLAAVKAMAVKFKIPLIIEPYEHSNWLKLVRGREQDKERGRRCLICYCDRLLKTAVLAKDSGFDFFSSSLLVSPYKDTAVIMNISRQLAIELAVSFLEDDFQANNIYRRFQEFAKELNIYRQKFCGCEFSLLKDK